MGRGAAGRERPAGSARWLVGLAALAVLGVVSACSPPRRDAAPPAAVAPAESTSAAGVAASPSPAAAQGPRVATSNTVLADLVRRVGAGRVAAVDSIVPVGVEVEDYNPAPSDLRRVAQADLVVMNGLALDRWVPRLVQAANPGVPTLVVAEGLPVLGLGASPQGDAAERGNPHLWLNVHNAMTYVERIRDQLAALDPPGARAYAANASAYLAELEALDRWIHAEVATIPPEERKLVTFHEAYPYFAEHYGFQLVGVIAPSPGQEPSAGELAALVETVKRARVKAVFSESQFSPRLAQALAREAGVRQVVADLYNDSLGPPPADSYVGMMRHNVERIVRALR